MADDILSALPACEGHFVTESGYHTNLWLSLDALFVYPRTLAPRIAALAARLRPYDLSAVCGPLLGGAFVAQALSSYLRIAFFFAEPVPGAAGPGLFRTRYRLPEALKASVRGARVAVVDDVISAGSSVRATASALVDAGASIAVVGTLFTLGSVGIDHFADAGIPVEALGHSDLAMWPPDACPLCLTGTPLQRRI